MSEVEQQESRKTVVAFIAGLLIGGLLVMVFGGDKDHKDHKMHDEDKDAVEEVVEVEDDSATEAEVTDTTEAEVVEIPAMKTGEGSITVIDQPAGSVVTLDSVTFPNDEGWIGVRDYTNGQLTGLLGVARFSKEQGLIPESVEVVRATEAGREYAVVFYTESGDRKFNLANDVLVEDTWARFTAK